MILEDAPLKKSILSALILPLFFLAACGKELPNEEVLQNLTNRSASLQSYHQLVSLKTTTEKEALTNTSEIDGAIQRFRRVHFPGAKNELRQKDQ